MHIVHGTCMLVNYIWFCSDEGLMLKMSALKLFMVANLGYQLSGWYLIT